MWHFSLRQVLVVISVLAGGLAVAVGKYGDWLDVPYTLLTYCFVLGLLRQFRTIQATLSWIPPEQEGSVQSCRMLRASLLGLTGMLSIAWVLRYGIAREILQWQPESLLTTDVQLTDLPRDTGLLAMLGAVGLSTWRMNTAPRNSWFTPLNACLGILVALAAVATFAAYQCFIPGLVTIAIGGMELAELDRFRPEGLDPNTSARAWRLAMAGVAGFFAAGLNLQIIAVLMRYWSIAWLRRMAAGLLIVGTAAQLVIAVWIIRRGLEQLSPPMSASVPIPRLAAFASVAGLAVVAAVSSAWRFAATASPIPRPSPIPAIPTGFQESWIACLAIALMGFVALIHAVGQEMFRSWRRPWIEFLETILQHPANYLLLAILVGGMQLALRRWWCRNALIPDSLPRIEPIQFLVISAAATLLVVSGGPIAIAFGVGIWCVT